VDRRHQIVLGQVAATALATLVLFAAWAARVSAQAPNPTSATNSFFGSVTARPATDEALRLSLDDAIALGLKNNLGLKEAENGEKSLQGQKNEALQEFLPTITFSGDLGVHQQDLVALGFGPGVAKQFSSLLPPGAKLSEITRDDLTEGQLHFNQMLFSGPVIAGWRLSARPSARPLSPKCRPAARWCSRWLRPISTPSPPPAKWTTPRPSKQPIRLLVRPPTTRIWPVQPPISTSCARASSFRSQQQSLINAENTYEKDLILLKREIGIDPGQKIALTDPAPYSDLATETPEEVRAIAYKSRQDYQNLQNQAVEFKAIHAAYRSQRLPSLSFSGYYGVSQVTGVGAHGNFIPRARSASRSSARPDCAATPMPPRPIWTPSTPSSTT
jgi:hypothetical protein